MSIAANEGKRRKAKDRDGLYRRRKHWHFDYKDPETGQWRSRSTGTTSYNDAEEFRTEFRDSLKGKYKPRNDRLKFAQAAEAYMEYRKTRAAAATVRLERERLRAVNRILAGIAGPDLKLKDFTIKPCSPLPAEANRRARRPPYREHGRPVDPLDPEA